MRYYAIINYGDRAHSNKRTLRALKKVFDNAGKEIVIRQSKSIKHSAELVAEAEEGRYDALLIGGGDGTINSILNLVVDKNFTLGLLPMGTTNALAQTIGTPRNVIKAGKALLEARTRNVSIGKINSNYFLCFASVGFDAATVHNVSPGLKLALSKYAFGLMGVYQLTQLKNLSKFSITYYPQNITDEGYCFIISNLPIYAGFKMFRALPYRSRMELYIFKNNSVLDYIKYMAGLAVTRGEIERLLPDTSRSFVERVVVRCPKRMYLQVDGEPYSIDNDREYEISVVRKGVRMLIPPRHRKRKK